MKLWFWLLRARLAEGYQIAKQYLNYLRLYLARWPIKPFVGVVPYNESISEFEAIAYRWEKSMEAIGAACRQVMDDILLILTPTLELAARLNTGICSEEEIWK